MKGFLASVITVTRLPLRRIIKIEKKHFKQTITYLPLTGYISGLSTIFTIYATSFILPLNIACLLGIIARLLLTGGINESGLSVFLNGFGNKKDKAPTRRIGAPYTDNYGIIGLSIYFLIYYNALAALPETYIFTTIIAADCFSKLCASTTVNTLNHPRPEGINNYFSVEYDKTPVGKFIIIALLSSIPIIFIPGSVSIIALPSTIICCIILKLYMNNRIESYTENSYGAAVLISETVFYISSIAGYYLNDSTAYME